MPPAPVPPYTSGNHRRRPLRIRIQGHECEPSVQIGVDAVDGTSQEDRLPVDQAERIPGADTARGGEFKMAY